jgi:serine protease Do
MRSTACRALVPVIVLALAAADANAQRGRSRIRSLRDDPSVVEVFAPVVVKAGRCAIALRRDGEVCALAAVVDDQGHLVTKASELGDEGELTCVVEAGESRRVVRVGVDELEDIAVLRVEDASDLVPVEWADADPTAGAWFVSTDGSNTVLGIGVFSAAVYEHSSKRGYLGVQLETVPSPVKLSLVQPNTAAAAAGLLAEDVILSMDGKELGDRTEFVRAVQARAPGDRIGLRVRRGDEVIDVEATLRRDRRGAPSDQEPLWGPLSDVRAGFGLVLQHDTILRPESCGGPVLDVDGKAVGINIARAGRIETLAIPAAVVQQIVSRVLGEAVVGGRDD